MSLSPESPAPPESWCTAILRYTSGWRVIGRDRTVAWLRDLAPQLASLPEKEARRTSLRVRLAFAETALKSIPEGIRSSRDARLIIRLLREEIACLNRGDSAFTAWEDHNQRIQNFGSPDYPAWGLVYWVYRSAEERWKKKAIQAHPEATQIQCANFARRKANEAVSDALLAVCLVCEEEIEREHLSWA